MGFWNVGPFDNTAAQELLEKIRCGAFNIEKFKFECAAESFLDVDDAAVVVALTALVFGPTPRPAGIGEEELRPLDSIGTIRWLRNNCVRVLDKNESGLYAQWEGTEFLDPWLQTTRSIAQHSRLPIIQHSHLAKPRITP